MLHNGITLNELAPRIGAQVVGDGGVVVRRIGSLEHGGADAVAFLSNPRLRHLAAGTRAGAVIVTPADVDCTARPRLVHADPYLTYARTATILHPVVAPTPGIDPTARIGAGTQVDPTASIGPYVVIGAGVRIGARVLIEAHACIADSVVLGDDVRIGPRVTIYAQTELGPRTAVLAGAVIGADGFGMVEDGGRWVKIPQVGRVIIGADCEIGANTTIDRGAIDDTVIEDDVKLDNQIQVGHNARIGTHTAVAGCVGIAGSAILGRNVRVGGAAMIAGHLSIADGTVLGAGTTVLSSIREPGFYHSAPPLMLLRDWRYVSVETRRLRTLVRRVSALEKRAGAPDPGPENES
ncbi:MAG: UDP-3-O-(3-hydroxymyristoyl)glucosamine N-acyltransferase [Burkholderiaceae bacterium]